MTFSVFVKKVFDRLYRYIWADHIWSSKYYCRYINKKIRDKNIWLLGIPRSVNLGDQAQVICSERLFAEQYPEYNVFEFDSVQLMNDNCMLIDYIASIVKKDDLVFFQSGYNLTDMYPFQEEMHREVVRRICNNRIVFLPQTISFIEPYITNDFVNMSLSIYKDKPNVYLMCRDRKSLSIAAEAFPSVKKIAFPDTVTTMIGRTKLSSPVENGVMLCVRHDVEGMYSEKELQELKAELSTIGKVEMIDTSVSSPSQFFIRRNREKYVMRMINSLHMKRVVVTDRYHGLIFSIVANTPVVLLKTIDHKITEGVKWFPDSMKNNVRIASSHKEVIEYAKELSDGPRLSNGTFFYDNYYCNLRRIIEDDSCWECDKRN